MGQVENRNSGSKMHIECISFKIFSLQKARQNDFYNGFKEVPWKVVLKRDLEDGHVHQLARMTDNKGRWTLDCKIMPTMPHIPSCRQAEI